MAQFYARVFVQILDSSIAEDFMVRHVFEDMLKVCDMSGVVDMTRTAMSRRFNVPLEELNRSIGKLEEPDPHSRDEEFEGRRIARLDEHRDWGWRILNWAKYDGIRTRADTAIRVARHRAKDAAAENGGGPPLARTKRNGSNRPGSVEEVIEAGKMIGVSEAACRKFWLHYQGTASQDENGAPFWVTGRTGEKRVGSWQFLLGIWKANDEERAAKAKSSARGRREVEREPGRPITAPVYSPTTSTPSTPPTPPTP